MATYTVEFNTQSSIFKAKIEIEIINNTSDKEYSTVKITPYLKRTDKSAWRSQHDWSQEFIVDPVYDKVTATLHYHGTKDYSVVDGNDSHWHLPNNEAQDGVESAGGLNMVKDKYYKWGNTQSFPVRNDGVTRYIGFRMYVGTSPWNCPASGYARTTFTPVKWTVDPTPPAGLKTEFDDNTRTIKYSWNTPNATCKRVSFTRETYNEYGIRLDSWGVGGTPATVTNCISETLDDDVAYVKWQVSHISVTDTVKESSWITYDTKTDCKVWIKTSNGWKKATPYVKVNGVWKKANKVYTKVNGVWKRTIM